MKASIKLNKKESTIFSLILPTSNCFLIYNTSQTRPFFIMAMDQKWGKIWDLELKEKLFQGKGEINQKGLSKSVEKAEVEQWGNENGVQKQHW